MADRLRLVRRAGRGAWHRTAARWKQRSCAESAEHLSHTLNRHLEESHAHTRRLYKPSKNQAGQAWTQSTCVARLRPSRAGPPARPAKESPGSLQKRTGSQRRQGTAAEPSVPWRMCVCPRSFLSPRRPRVPIKDMRHPSAASSRSGRLAESSLDMSKVGRHALLEHCLDTIIRLHWSC